MSIDSINSNPTIQNDLFSAIGSNLNDLNTNITYLNYYSFEKGPTPPIIVQSSGPPQIIYQRDIIPIGVTNSCSCTYNLNLTCSDIGIRILLFCQIDAVSFASTQFTMGSAGGNQISGIFNFFYDEAFTPHTFKIIIINLDVAVTTVTFDSNNSLTLFVTENF